MLCEKTMYSLSIIIVIFCFLMLLATGQKLAEELYRAGRQQNIVDSINLSDNQFKKFSSLENRAHFNKTLKKILIPRVVATPGHREVREHIIDSMEHLGWTIERDIFIAEVPHLKIIEFENVIAKLNPKAERFLVLACHYDSKYMPHIKFVGATDSAVPCAMLINIAFVLQEELNKVKNQKLSLMFVFFDGEEAFDTWTENDSIYGARHLSKIWSKDGFDFLNRLDMIVLLDLLGAPNPQFYSFFANTEPWYAKMMALEEKLAQEGMLKRSNRHDWSKPDRYFKPNSLRTNDIEDDHIPFQKLGVPIVHLIPWPFPKVWHSEDDNLKAIDFETVENLIRIMQLFIMEYLLAN